MQLPLRVLAALVRDLACDRCFDPKTNILNILLSSKSSSPDLVGVGLNEQPLH